MEGKELIEEKCFNKKLWMTSCKIGESLNKQERSVWIGSGGGSSASPKWDDHRGNKASETIH